VVSHGAVANTVAPMTGLATVPAMRDAARDVADIAGNLAIERRPSDVALDPELGPVPRWYLRGEVLAGPVSSDPARPAILVASASARAPRGAYSAQRYVIAQSRATGPLTWKAVWRWLVYKEGSGPPVPIEAVVYVRTAAQRP